MPGASGWPCRCRHLRRPHQRAAEHALDLLARQPPGRSSIGASKHPTMVDSTPTSTAPPSTIRSIRPARSLCTWAAVVGETWPDRLADGATTGPPNARRMSRATGWAGTRIATVSSPAVARSATAQSAVLGSTSVSGPGQNASASRGRRRSKRAIRRAACEIADMGDQRIEGGPALGLVEPRDRGRIGGIGAKAVDGLGRERDQPALGQARARQRPRRPRRRAKSAFSGPHSRGLISSIRLLAVRETQGYKPRSCRSVAQPGRALRSGRRIRTCDPCVPNAVLYRAEPHSD